MAKRVIIRNNEAKETPEETIARLQAELAEAKKAKAATVSFKVTEKGGVSVYGLGRFPVTLYKQQWERLFGVKDELESFIQENAASLSTK